MTPLILVGRSVRDRLRQRVRGVRERPNRLKEVSDRRQRREHDSRNGHKSTHIRGRLEGGQRIPTIGIEGGGFTKGSEGVNEVEDNPPDLPL